MKKICLFIFASLFMFSANVGAQTSEGVASFKQDKDAWRRKEEVDNGSKGEVIQKIKDALPKHGLNNILQSERIFCYTVDKAPKDYKGYTLNGMAVTGFCGILNEKDKDILLKEFFYKENSVSNVMAKCMIEPKIIIRFVKGVDYTDVLLSAPCHSFSVFYGGKVKSFNVEPVAKLLEAVVQIFAKNKSEFISPALLDQLLPIGIAKTPEQKALVKEKSGDAPVRNWNTDTVKPVSATQNPVKKGWGKLKK